MHTLPITAALAITLTAPLALAGDCGDPEHADVELGALDGALRVGSGDFCDGAFIPDWSVRVFSASFFNNPALPDFFNGKATNPGFNAQSGAFAPGTAINFNILGPLRIWDEQDMNFDTIPVETLTISTAEADVTTPPNEGDVEPGFFFVSADSAGSFHVHPTFALGEPKGDGVYLLTLELTAPNAGLDPAAPIFIVLNQKMDEAILEQAIAYAETQLVPGDETCPADTNGDGVVDSTDLNNLLAQFGDMDEGLSADIDGDGDVDSTDLNNLLAAFGTPC